MPLPDHPIDRMDAHHHHGGHEDVSHTVSALIRDVAVLSTRMGDAREDVDRRLKMQERAVDIAIKAAEKTTNIAQQTADRATKIAQQTAEKAVLKAEAAASREYLEAEIKGLAEVAEANLASQKDALHAALIAAKEALVQAQENSDKAIAKAEQASEARFASVNEFRKTLGDQAGQFANKSEVDFRVQGLNMQLLDLKSRLDKGEGRHSVAAPKIEEDMRILKDMVISLSTSRDGGSAAAAAKTAQTGFIIAAVIATVAVGGFSLTLFSKPAGSAGTNYLSSTVQENTEQLQRLKRQLNSLPPSEGAR